MNNLTDTLLYLLLISIATERLIELVKLSIPKRQWKNQRLWKLFIGSIGAIIGSILAWNIAPLEVISDVNRHLSYSIILGLVSSIGSKAIRDVSIKS